MLQNILHSFNEKNKFPGQVKGEKMTPPNVIFFTLQDYTNYKLQLP